MDRRTCPVSKGKCQTFNDVRQSTRARCTRLVGTLSSVPVSTAICHVILVAEEQFILNE